MRYNPARMVVNHDEGVSAEGDDRFKDFPRVSQCFVEGSLTDRNHLDEFLLGVERDHSEELVREEPHFGTKLRYRERCMDKESCAFLAQRDGR
jgi:hypothetical protein